MSQGITTIVVGQDGGSQLPLAAFFARLDSQPAAVNVASYVGHGTLRRRVMGDDFARVATDAEVARMRDLLREEMAAGALGLSTGLEYDPGIFSAPGEVLELAKVAARRAAYISHIRSEDREFWQALDELLNIGREAKIPVQVSHMKLAMRGLWGQGDSSSRARARAARGHSGDRRRLPVHDVAVHAHGAVPQAQFLGSRRDRVHPEGSRRARGPRDRGLRAGTVLRRQDVGRSPRFAGATRPRRSWR